MVKITVDYITSLVTIDNGFVVSSCLLRRVRPIPNVSLNTFSLISDSLNFPLATWSNNVWDVEINGETYTPATMKELASLVQEKVFIG